MIKGFHKEYYSSGKPSRETSGKFHYGDDGNIVLENASEKWWYENGNLEFNIVFPKYARAYSSSGILDIEMEGALFYDDNGIIQLQDGFRKEYYENKKIALQKKYKGRKLVGKTEWNENGIVTISVELPNSYKEFYDDGRMKAIATGVIVEENEAFKIKDGIYNEYDQNGEVTYYATYKNFQIISEMK